MHRVYLFFTSLPILVISYLFYSSHSKMYKVILIFLVVLFFISLMIRDDEHILMYLLAIWVSSLEKKCLFSFSAHFLNSFLKRVAWVLYIFWMWNPLYGFQIFAPIPSVVFSFAVSFAVQNLFSLMSSHLLIFVFVLPVSYLKNISKTNVKDCSLYFLPGVLPYQDLHLSL